MSFIILIASCTYYFVFILLFQLIDILVKFLNNLFLKSILFKRNIFFFGLNVIFILINT